MLLHQNQDEFKALIRGVADHYKMKEYQIEKDYYVSLFLKRLSQENINLKIVFKGGTSLSKCHQIIDRFSEDVDLAVASDTDRVTEGQRRKLKEVIVETAKSLGMSFSNLDKVHSRRDYNLYHVHYGGLFRGEGDMLPHILIETIVAYKPYPCDIREVSNYITNYLIKKNRSDLIEQYDLFPFEMPIQSLERTFVDKLFAICDYHLEGKYERYSRHIYDVHMIWKSGILNTQTVEDIMDDVIKDRQIQGDRNLSAKPGVKPNQLLKEIIDKNVYENDYNGITRKFIHKFVSYETCIESIREIIDKDLLPSEIKTYR